MTLQTAPTGCGPSLDPHLNRRKNIKSDDQTAEPMTIQQMRNLPDPVPDFKVGHISPQMLKHYTHIRRQAMNQAAAALEPTWMTEQQPPTAELLN